jgi:hypothetical protein
MLFGLVSDNVDSASHLSLIQFYVEMLADIGFQYEADKITAFSSAPCNKAENMYIPGLCDSLSWKPYTTDIQSTYKISAEGTRRNTCRQKQTSGLSER